MATALKSFLMWMYARELLSFEVTERVAGWLRRYRWFREG